MQINDDKRITILEEAFKYVQSQLSEIKGMIKSLATLRDIADMESKMQSLDNKIITIENRIDKKIDELSAEVKEIQKQNTQMMIKIASITSIVTFITAFIVDVIIKK